MFIRLTQWKNINQTNKFYQYDGKFSYKVYLDFDFGLESE